MENSYCLGKQANSSLLAKGSMHKRDETDNAK